jgi:hypothetical protein
MLKDKLQLRGFFYLYDYIYNIYAIIYFLRSIRTPVIE